MDRSKPVFATLFLLTAVLILLLFLLAAVPPVSRDALTHHLAVPNLYINHGRIYEIPDLVASYFPMNLDLLYALPLMFGNDIAPKYIHMAFGLLSAILLYRYIRRRLNRSYALFGVLLFLSLPIIVQLSITVYVDLGLIFFSTASILCLLKWFETRRKLRYLIMAAVSCGLALGTKYNGLVVFLLLTFSVPYLYAQNSSSKSNIDTEGFKWSIALGYTVIFVLVSVAIFSPWALRNYLWTGNPLYPLYDTLFNPQNPFFERKLNPFAIRRMLYHESIWQTLAVPFRIFFQGQDNDPALFDGRLNPYLIIFAIPGIFFGDPSEKRIKVEKTIWAGFAILFILMVFFTREMRIRYIAPAILPLVILNVFGVKNIFYWLGKLKKGPRRSGIQMSIVFGLLFLLSLNCHYLYRKWETVRPLDYLCGKMDRESYILHYRPEYAVIRYANKNITNEHRLLCVFLGNRRYYFQKETMFLEWAQFKEMLDKSKDSSDMVSTLREKHITHIVIGVNGLKYWSGKTLTEKNQEILKKLLSDHSQILVEINGYALLKIR